MQQAWTLTFGLCQLVNLQYRLPSSVRHLADSRQAKPGCYLQILKLKQLTSAAAIPATISFIRAWCTSLPAAYRPPRIKLSSTAREIAKLPNIGTGSSTLSLLVLLILVHGIEGGSPCNHSCGQPGEHWCTSVKRRRPQRFGNSDSYRQGRVALEGRPRLERQM